MHRLGLQDIISYNIDMAFQIRIDRKSAFIHHNVLFPILIEAFHCVPLRYWRSVPMYGRPLGPGISLNGFTSLESRMGSVPATVALSQQHTN